MVSPIDCFISYSSADLCLAEILYEKLSQAGYSVWFDRVRLEPGYDWQAEIEQACECSSIIIPLLTPNWRQSIWTKYETYGHDAVIPILAHGSFDECAPSPIRRWQALCIEGKLEDQPNWAKLCKSVDKLLERDDIRPSRIWIPKGLRV